MENLEKSWNEVVEYLQRGGFNPASFNTWIASLRPHSLADGDLVLAAKNEYVQSTVNNRYIGRIKNAISQVWGLDLQINVRLESQIAENGQVKAGEVTENEANLSLRYQFDSFVRGKSNEFAFAAAEAVAERPGDLYNPLFLHGDVGLGKTHLMQAIGNEILFKKPGLKVLYTTSENLTNEFIYGIRHNKNQEFRDKYRTLDILLCDDIQFLTDKEGTQEEFFHMFNALHNNSKQIVLTSDKPPFELKTLEERLRSRFSSGLTVDITSPDLETRIAILQKKAEMERILIDKEVVYFIAKSVPSNIRELEGALNTVCARAKLTNSVCDVHFAEKTLEDMLNQGEKRIVDVPYILDVVSAYYGISVELIQSRKRTKDVTYARHIAMYLSRKYIDKPLTAIGIDFGGRDHSTVIHATDKIAAELEENRRMRQEIAELEKKLKSD